LRVWVICADSTRLILAQTPENRKPRLDAKAHSTPGVRESLALRVVLQVPEKLF
jgi:hypothetical protein